MLLVVPVMASDLADPGELSLAQLKRVCWARLNIAGPGWPPAFAPGLASRGWRNAASAWQSPAR
jgi:hypothetical protein